MFHNHTAHNFLFSYTFFFKFNQNISDLLNRKMDVILNNPKKLLFLMFLLYLRKLKITMYYELHALKLAEYTPLKGRYVVLLEFNPKVPGYV